MPPRQDPIGAARIHRLEILNTLWNYGKLLLLLLLLTIQRIGINTSQLLRKHLGHFFSPLNGMCVVHEQCLRIAPEEKTHGKETDFIWQTSKVNE